MTFDFGTNIFCDSEGESVRIGRPGGLINGGGTYAQSVRDASQEVRS
jgi:hypothetical protein